MSSVPSDPYGVPFTPSGRNELPLSGKHPAKAPAFTKADLLKPFLPYTKANIASTIKGDKAAMAMPPVSSEPTLPYSAAPLSADYLERSGVLHYNKDIANLQEQLIKAGYHIVVDGIKGPETTDAIAQFLKTGGQFTSAPEAPSAEQLSAPPPQQSQQQMNQEEGTQELGQVNPLLQNAQTFASPGAMQGINDVAQPLARAGEFISPPAPTNYKNALLDVAYLLPVITGPARIGRAALLGIKAARAADEAAPAVSKLAKAGGTASKSLFHDVGNVNAFGAIGGSQLTSAALNAPGGLVGIGEHPIRFSKELEQQFTRGLTDTHDPTIMAMDWFALLSGSRGHSARLGAAADALSSHEGLRAALTREGHEGGSLLKRPTTKLRSLKIANGTEHPLLESNNHLMRDIQGVHDKIVQSFMNRSPFGVIGKYGSRRVRGYGMAARRVSEAHDMALANHLKALTKPGVGGLDAAEHKALSLANNNTSVEHRLEYVKQQLLHSTTPEEVDQHVAELKLLSEVKERNLTQVVHDEEGKPHVTINPEKGHLAYIGGVDAAAQVLNKHINADTGAISPEQEQSRINAPGKIMRGGKFDTYANHTLENLGSSAKRQSIVNEATKQLGPEQASTLMRLLDSQAIRFAQAHGDPLHPERFYDQLLGITKGEPLHPDALLQLLDHLVRHDSRPSDLGHDLMTTRTPWIYDNTHDVLHVGNPASDHTQLSSSISQSGHNLSDDTWDGVHIADGRVFVHSNLGHPHFGNPLHEDGVLDESTVPNSLKDKLNDAFGTHTLHQRGGPYNPDSAIKDQSHIDKPGAYGIKGAITITPHGAHLHTFESSDFSTWSHELLGHFNLEHGSLDKNSMRSIIRSAGIRGVKGVNPKLTLEDLTTGEKTHVHEFFARQLESWLKQGRTANPALQQTMRRAATTMGDIYGAGELPELAPRVASLFDRLYGHELPKGEGIVGGDSEWEGHGYHPGALTEPNANPAASRRFQGPKIARAQSSLPKKRYTGAGMENSQHPARPAYQFAKHLQRNVRDLQTLRARKEVAAMGTDELPVGVKPDEMYLVNNQELKDAKVPDWAKKAIGETRSTQDEMSEDDAQGLFNQFHARLFVNAKNFRDAFQGNPERIKEFEQAFQDGTAVKGYKWVHPSLIGKDLTQIAQSSTNKAWQINDAVTHAEKNLVVYLKPGHFATRFMANAGFNVVQGAFSLPTLKASLSWYYGLKPSEFRAAEDISKTVENKGTYNKAQAVGGQGYAQSLEGSDHGLGAQFGHAGARFYASWVDAPARFNAVVHESRRAGYNTLPKFKELMNSNDPKVVADRNRIGIKANREAGDYARMGPVEQRIIRRIFYFYPWVKASTMWAGRALMEHPIQSAALLNAGIIGKQNADQRLGKRDERDQSLIPFGHGEGLETVNPSGLSPIATPAELIQSGESAVGLRPSTSDNQPSTWLGPVPKTLGDMAFHLNPFGDAATPNQSIEDIAYNDLIKSSPEAGLIKGLMSGAQAATANPKEFPTTPTSAAERFGAGSWFPRPTNKDTMNYEGYKEEATNTGNTGDLDTYNLTHSAAAVGITSIPTQVIQEIHARANLLSQMKKGMDDGQRAIIAAQYLNDSYFIELAHQFQHNEYASSRLYAQLRKLIYGNYLNFKAQVTALQHRQAALGG